MEASFYRAPAEGEERLLPGSTFFHQLGGYNLYDHDGCLCKGHERLITPVKQVLIGGFVRVKGQSNLVSKPAIKSAMAQHVYPPHKTPVGGNIPRIVGSAMQEEDGKPYPDYAKLLNTSSHQSGAMPFSKGGIMGSNHGKGGIMGSNLGNDAMQPEELLNVHSQR